MGAKLGGGGGRRGGRRRGGMMAEINVTPMVDVMLVLLIIFMVAAPLLTAGVSLDLPKAKAKAISQQDNAPLEVSVDGKGNIFIGDTKVSEDQLGAKLRAIAGETPVAEKRIYVRADQKIGYGRVMSVMAAINTAGFVKIALVTDPTMARQ